jgi:predicted ester cyclase
MGIAPTGKTVSFRSMAMLRVTENKIVAAWVNEDDLGLMRQLESAHPPC